MSSGDSPRVVSAKCVTRKDLHTPLSQATQALDISRSTLRGLLPYTETTEMPWAKLRLADELECLAAERRRIAARDSSRRRRDANRGRLSL